MVWSKHLNTRKHRHQEQAIRGWSRLGPKGKRSGSGFRTWPDANVAPPVYRVDLTRPVVDVKHGKAVSVIPPWLVQGKPTARQAQGRRHGEDRRSNPRRSGLSLSEHRWNHSHCEMQMTIDTCRLVRLRSGIRIAEQVGR